MSQDLIMNSNALWDTVQTWLFNTGIRLVISVLILLISFSLINRIARRINRKGENAEDSLNKTIYKSFSHVFRLGMKILIGVAIVGYLGIDTTGMAALIASLGVGVGMAINGTLSNFAGGVLLIILHPFHDDDYISACGYEGIVEDIHLTYTKLVTLDNKVVYLPNGLLSSGTIVNNFEKENRRIDLVFSIAYSADFDLARKAIQEIFAEDARVLKDPAPAVVMSAHSTSSIDITARAWVVRADYWTVRFDTIEKVKKAFDEKGIEIPFTQVDVHVKNG